MIRWRLVEPFPWKYGTKWLGVTIWEIVHIHSLVCHGQSETTYLLKATECQVPRWCPKIRASNKHLFIQEYMKHTRVNDRWSWTFVPQRCSGWGIYEHNRLGSYYINWWQVGYELRLDTAISMAYIQPCSSPPLVWVYRFWLLILTTVIHVSQESTNTDWDWVCKYSKRIFCP